MPWLNTDKTAFFVHIPKTAGTTVESIYSANTYFIPKSHRTAFFMLSARERFFRKIFSLIRKLNTSSLQLESCFGGIYQPLSLQHLTLDELIWLGLEPIYNLRNASIYTIVRDPLDRIISIWSSHGRRKLFPDINDFILTYLDGSKVLTHDELSHIRPQSHYIYSDQISLASVNVLRFENLKNDIQRLVDHVPPTYPFSLPHHNNSGISKSEKQFLKQNISSHTLKLLFDYYSIDYINFDYPMTR